MQKEQDREAIYRSIFFCDMDRKKADEIIDRLGGRTVTYDKGEIIIREREKLNNIGILLDGVLCKVAVLPGWNRTAGPEACQLVCCGSGDCGQ